MSSGANVPLRVLNQTNCPAIGGWKTSGDTAAGLPIDSAIPSRSRTAAQTCSSDRASAMVAATEPEAAGLAAWQRVKRTVRARKGEKCGRAKWKQIPTANSTAHQSKSRSLLVRRLHGCVRQPFTGSKKQAAFKAALLGGVAAAARLIGRCTESGFLSRLFPLHSVTVAASENRGESQ